MSGILLFPYVDNLEKEIHPKSSDLSSETKQLSPHALEILFVAKKTMGLDAVLGILFAKSALGFMFAGNVLNYLAWTLLKTSNHFYEIF